MQRSYSKNASRQASRRTKRSAQERLVRVKGAALARSVMTWDRRGLESLVEKAAAHFHTATGIALPYNLHWSGPWHGWKYRRQHTANRSTFVATAARLAGFLTTIADAPLARYCYTRRLFRRCTSASGMGSPHTVFSPYDLIDRWGGPQNVEAKLRHVRLRASQILFGWGIGVSWLAMAQVMLRGDRRPRKMALRAAAITLVQLHERLPYCLLDDIDPEVRPLEALIALRGLKHLTRKPSAQEQLKTLFVLDDELDFASECGILT